MAGLWAHSLNLRSKSPNVLARLASLCDWQRRCLQCDIVHMDIYSVRTHAYDLEIQPIHQILSCFICPWHLNKYASLLQFATNKSYFLLIPDALDKVSLSHLSPHQDHWLQLNGPYRLYFNPKKSKSMQQVLQNIGSHFVLIQRRRRLEAKLCCVKVFSELLVLVLWFLQWLWCKWSRLGTCKLLINSGNSGLPSPRCFPVAL